MFFNAADQSAAIGAGGERKEGLLETLCHVIMFWADRKGGHYTVCALFSSPFNSNPTPLPFTARHSQGSDLVIVDNIKHIL